MLKKIWKFLCSMRFAILLLAILAVACSVSSLITQNQSYNWYAQRYSERTAAVIMALRLDDAFHSPWFIVITAFLCLNLMLCNLMRLPQLLRRYRAEGDASKALSGEGDVSTGGVTDPKAVYARPEATDALAAFHVALTENGSPGFRTSGAETSTPPTGDGVSTRSTTTAPFAPMVSRKWVPAHEASGTSSLKRFLMRVRIGGDGTSSRPAA